MEVAQHVMQIAERAVDRVRLRDRQVQREQVAPGCLCGPVAEPAAELPHPRRLSGIHLDYLYQAPLGAIRNDCAYAVERERNSS
jgi:hypothetical protein